LHFAANTGQHKEVAELLLAKGVDINAKADDGWTPLHLAARSGNKEVVELLIFKGADIGAKDSSGKTALQWAVKYRHGEVDGMLRKAGAKE
jgi:ankyrin repeat protein